MEPRADQISLSSLSFPSYPMRRWRNLTLRASGQYRRLGSTEVLYSCEYAVMRF